VWYDRDRLEPGDEWELRIVEELHACEAAVLLLTPEALESSWVLREATVLADRRSRWPALQLVPVLCAGVDYRTLAGLPHWAALNITRWQPVQATRSAFRGKAARQDADEIVAQVSATLTGLQAPSDPERDRWAEELLALLNDMARRGLFTRLQGAARALRLKAPLQWDKAALQGLTRALLQSALVERDAAGDLRCPLAEALSSLFPGDPQAIQLAEAERQFCRLLQPLAAPPTAAAAVGSARAEAAGQAQGPLLMRTGKLEVAELAARRSSCGTGWVRPLSDVVGEEGASALDLGEVTRAIRMATLARKPCYVVASLTPVTGEDPASMASALASRLPRQATLVSVIGRNTPAAPGALASTVVDVPQADEDGTLDLNEYIDTLCGKH
jgi:hypothetical protein